MIIYVVVVCHNLTQVESIRNLRKFGVLYDRDFSGRVNDVYEDFKNKIQLEKCRSREEELEKKRQEVYKKFLLSRAYAPILKDFYSRFQEMNFKHKMKLETLNDIQN